MVSWTPYDDHPLVLVCSCACVFMSQHKQISASLCAKLEVRSHRNVQMWRFPSSNYDTGGGDMEIPGCRKKKKKGKVQIQKFLHLPPPCIQSFFRENVRIWKFPFSGAQLVLHLQV